MRTIDAGIGIITHLAFNPLGTHLAAAGHRGLGLGPWPALAEGRGPFAVRMSRDKVAQVAWHPAGHRLAAACHDGFVQLWNTRLQLSRELGDLPGQQAPMLAVAFSPGGGQLAFGGGWLEEPGCATVVQSTGRRQSRHIEAHTNEIGALTFLRDGVLVTGSSDKTVIAHPLSRPDEFIPFPALPSPVQALATQPGGDRLAIAAGNLVYLWRMRADGRPRADGQLTCRGHKYKARAISYSPDGRTLASAGEDGTLRFWDADAGAEKSCLDVGLKGLRAVAFAADGLTVAVGGDAGTVAIVDVDR